MNSVGGGRLAIVSNRNKEVGARPWPAKSIVRVLSVVDFVPPPTAECLSQ